MEAGIWGPLSVEDEGSPKPHACGHAHRLSVKMSRLLEPPDIPRQDGRSIVFSGKRSPWSCMRANGWIEIAAPLRGPRRVLRLREMSPDVVEWYSVDGGLPEFLELPMGQLFVSTVMAIHRLGAVFHSAAFLVAQGEATIQRCLLLCGVSGAGKSTCSQLLANAGVSVLTDERSIVWSDVGSGRLMWSGSPWNGTAGIAQPGEAPLGGVFFIRHADRNYVEPVSKAQAVTELFRTCFPTFWYCPGLEFALEFCIRMASEVPCKTLGFRPDESAADFLLGKLGE